MSEINTVYIRYAPHSAGNVTEDNPSFAATEYSTLTDVINTHTSANVAYFVHVMTLMQANHVTTYLPNPTHITHRKRSECTYCWSHGRSDDLAHTNTTCENLKESHKDAAKWNNNMEASTRDYGVHVDE